MDAAKPSFTAHNIVLDDGTCTKPDAQATMAGHPWCIAAQRTLSTVFPGDKSPVRVADLGCLEGGYAVELARMGFQVLGLEVRESNFAACQFVKSRVDLPNLEFVRDNAWNIAKYGEFDAIFCCGLFYHLDEPRRFLDLLASVTRKCLLLQTHFAHGETNAESGAGSPLTVRGLRARLTGASVRAVAPDKFNLSAITRHEGLEGRWYTEYPEEPTDTYMETQRWSSWGNQRSFWIRREHLIGALNSAGFDLVLEQFDGLAPDVTGSMIEGYYKTDRRSMFVGIKTG